MADDLEIQFAGFFGFRNGVRIDVAKQRHRQSARDSNTVEQANGSFTKPGQKRLRIDSWGSALALVHGDLAQRIDMLGNSGPEVYFFRVATSR